MGTKVKLKVWRGDAGQGDLVDYEVEANEGEVVLDILHRLQATQASDLAVRWNCKAGKCGSCSMEINGQPRLACMTRMSLFDPAETITLTPMRTFPVIRDLVTDVSFNYAKARELPSFAQDDFGLGYCNITKCCTEVCPENIKITDNALIPMKERVVGRKYDPLVWLGSKITRRRHHDPPAVSG